MPKLLLLTNYDYAFLTHRQEIVKRAVTSGYEVIVAAKNTGRSAEIEALGARFVSMPGTPTGMNPQEEFKTLKFITDMYRRERPDIVHHVVVKNVLWGSIAAKIAKVPGVLNAVCGLGSLFNMPLGWKPKLIMRLIRYGTRRPNVLTIFQNNEDRDLFMEHGIVKAEDCLYTKGSGVDLEKFAYSEPPKGGKVVVLFSARMVAEKGVYTLVEAAEMLRPGYEDKLEFRLCGDLSKNPNAVPLEWLERHCNDNYIKWLGDRHDMHKELAQCHIMAFPSWYREGVPKAVIEACSVGRPIVTTDSVGCRDTVDDGVNGFLVPVNSPQELADRIAQLADDPELRQRMGVASRRKAERDFNVEGVVAVHMEAYERLMNASKR